MKIGIISAMEKERRLLLPLLGNAEEIEINGLKATRGQVGEHEVILSKCGIGKVNAAINTYKIIETFGPDLIINSGVAGGASLKTEIGDLLVADYVAYHDVWCGPGTQPGVADGMDVFMACDGRVIQLAHSLYDGKRLQVGLICSGDRFISEKEEVEEIHRLFPEVLAVDMESAAIAQVCCMESVKFNILRVISDTPGSGRNIEEYKDFWSKAPETTFGVIAEILRSI